MASSSSGVTRRDGCRIGTSRRTSGIEMFDRHASAVAGFFGAAFEESLWASRDPDRDAAARQELAARFNELLQAEIASDPERTACRWHVVVLDIAKPRAGVGERTCSWAAVGATGCRRRARPSAV